MPANNDVFRQRLADLMSEQGWSRNRLSVAAGLARGTVGDYLSNPTREPRPAAVHRLANALGVSADYLSGRTQAREEAGAIDRAKGAGAEVAQAVMTAVDNSDGRLQALRARDGTAWGVSPSAIVLCDTSARAESGRLAIVTDAEGGPCVRFYVEPYLVGIKDGGEPFHEVRPRVDGSIWPVVAVLRLA